MRTAAEVAALLGGKRHSSYWLCRCPAHNDANPSLSVSEGENGKVLFKCHTGCSQDAVLDAIKARGIFGTEAPSNGYQERKRSNGHLNGRHFKPETGLVHRQFGKPHLKHEYYDKDGVLVGVVCRWDYDPDPAEREPRKRKEIVPAVPDGIGWQWKAMPAPRPLYGLLSVLAEPSKPVLIVEGEKTADAARDIVDGYVVVTWAGGSSAINQTDWTPLIDREVVIWPDHDEAGTKAAANISAKLPKARIVAVSPHLPPKWDLADWKPGDPDTDELIRKAKNPLQGRSLADIMETDYPEPKWAVPGLVPDGITILAGPKSRGKSWILLDWAIAIAGGYNALGNIECEAGPCLYLALEDNERRIKGRAKSVLQDRKPPPNLQVEVEWPLADNGGLKKIEAWIALNPGARAVIVDVLAKIKGRPNRDKGVYDQDYEVITPFKKIALKTGVAIILAHHTNKAGNAADPVLAVSGTMGLTGAADTVLVLQRDANDPNGMLYVRGRDVPEGEIALEFSKETGTVTQLGAADDFRKSKERREILRLLVDAPDGLMPNEIAKMLKKDGGSTRALINKMHKDGQIQRLQNGKYTAW